MMEQNIKDVKKKLFLGRVKKEILNATLSSDNLQMLQEIKSGYADIESISAALDAVLGMFRERIWDAHLIPRNDAEDKNWQWKNAEVQKIFTDDIEINEKKNLKKDISTKTDPSSNPATTHKNE